MQSCACPFAGKFTYWSFKTYGAELVPVKKIDYFSSNHNHLSPIQVQMLSSAIWKKRKLSWFLAIQLRVAWYRFFQENTQSILSDIMIWGRRSKNEILSGWKPEGETPLILLQQELQYSFLASWYKELSPRTHVLWSFTCAKRHLSSKQTDACLIVQPACTIQFPGMTSLCVKNYICLINFIQSREVLFL